MRLEEARVCDAEIRGLKTAWLEAGEPGNPIVFLCHGFPDDPYAWSEQIDELAKTYHVIAPYVRGCDRSAPSDVLSRYGTAAILLDHLEILQRVQVCEKTQVAVIGHDLGAAHGIELARALGTRLACSIVINGTDVGTFARRLAKPQQMKRSWYMGFMQVPLLPEAAVKLIPESCAWLAGELGGLKKELRETVGFDRRTLAPLNQYRAFAREIPRRNKERPARLRAPLLVLWGRDDSLLEPPAKEEWERLGLDITIRILVGGHWLHREQPALINPILSRFLAAAFSQANLPSLNIKEPNVRMESAE